jgi:hypothetical protein
MKDLQDLTCFSLSQSAKITLKISAPKLEDCILSTWQEVKKLAKPEPKEKLSIKPKRLTQV